MFVITSTVASLDVVVGTREHVLYERVEPRVVVTQFRPRVNVVVESVGWVSVRIGVEIALHSLALCQRHTLSVSTVLKAMFAILLIVSSQRQLS